ncbi:MAG: hypothetical protein C0473_03735 [Cyanobacteria bacterium DS3.002]|nr:hypothetical protein [Cyanobacteria bacterium DS3.002]MBA4049890.1 hypothetical protein [Cyanobacteria bacterium DS2.008]
MMKVPIYLAVLLSFTFIPAGFCEENKDLLNWNQETKYSSHCDGSNKCSNPFDEDLKSCSKWLLFCSESISNTTSLKLLERIPSASCTFFVRAQGRIEGLKMENSSGSSELDTLLTEAVSKASPIKYAPPNPTPLMRALRARIQGGKLTVEAVR